MENVSPCARRSLCFRALKLALDPGRADGRRAVRGRWPVLARLCAPDACVVESRLARRLLDASLLDAAGRAHLDLDHGRAAGAGTALQLRGDLERALPNQLRRYRRAGVDHHGRGPRGLRRATRECARRGEDDDSTHPPWLFCRGRAAPARAACALWPRRAARTRTAVTSCRLAP